MVGTPIHIAYSGIRKIYLRTYTTTYPFYASGWNWNNNSLYPMEFAGYVDNVYGHASGFKARMIDFATGYSEIIVGAVGAGNTQHDDQFGKPTYDASIGNVCGFYFGALVTTTDPLFMDYHLPWDGQSRTIANLNGFSPGIPFSTNPNTGMPNPGWGLNKLRADKSIYCSFEDNLTPFAALMARYPFWNSAYNNANTIGLNFPTSARCGEVISDNVPLFANPTALGSEWVFIEDGTGGTVPYNVVHTDFQTGASYLQVTSADQPASSTVNFATWFSDANKVTDGHATPFGFLVFDGSTQTFDGVTMNGFIVAIAYDFSEYAILNVIPQDAGAANWNSQPASGSPSIKADRSGRLWMRNANIPATLLIGAKIPWGIDRLNIQADIIPPHPLPVNPGLYR